MERSNLAEGYYRAKAVDLRWLFGLAACIGSVLTMAGNVRADILCSWFLQCFYQSPGFKIRVVDKETGKPLADVHALAEWVQYGMYGQYPLLVAQDATSGADGMLNFPPWGPTRGPSSGLVLNQDPVITLYKREYEVLTINNAPGTDERARVRGLTQTGQTFAIGVFLGSFDEREKHLFRARGLAVPGNEASKALFREPYLNRLRRILVELSNEPRDYEAVIFQINRAIKSFEEAKR